jgi:hypothetical protein
LDTDTIANSTPVRSYSPNCNTDTQANSVTICVHRAPRNANAAQASTVTISDQALNPHSHAHTDQEARNANAEAARKPIANQAPPCITKSEEPEADTHSVIGRSVKSRRPDFRAGERFDLKEAVPAFPFCARHLHANPSSSGRTRIKLVL